MNLNLEKNNTFELDIHKIIFDKIFDNAEKSFNNIIEKCQNKFDDFCLFLESEIAEEYDNLKILHNDVDYFTLKVIMKLININYPEYKIVSK
jgi:hypothetical protein